jgi:hypothetical protein
VAAPESANNAGAQTSFIPMLTLGIPSNPVMALMIGALMVHGITPGPRVMTERPELFWGIVASMWDFASCDIRSSTLWLRTTVNVHGCSFTALGACTADLHEQRFIYESKLASLRQQLQLPVAHPWQCSLRACGA